MVQNNVFPDFDHPDVCECEETNGCSRIGCQCVDISVPLEIKPNTKIGEIKAECCGEPNVSCKNNHAENRCEITITQTLCIKIPLDYRVTACIGEEEINCSDMDCKE